VPDGNYYSLSLIKFVGEDEVGRVAEDLDIIT